MCAGRTLNHASSVPGLLVLWKRPWAEMLCDASTKGTIPDPTPIYKSGRGDIAVSDSICGQQPRAQL